MSLQIKPVFSALRRHRIAVVLVVAEIALACAILCNALFLVIHRGHLMHAASGVDENRLVLISLNGIDDTDALDIATRLKRGFRGIAGVESVSVANAAPFTERAGEDGFRLDANDPHYHHEGHFYLGDADYIRTLGLRVVKGRAFNANDFASVGDFFPKTDVILVDQQYAQQLWPGQDALGKLVYPAGGTIAYRVIGEYRRLIRPDPGPSAFENTFVLPVLAGKGVDEVYILRTDPGQRARVLADARKVVAREAPSAVVLSDYTGTMSGLRQSYFAGERATSNLLMGVIAALMLVTALGIVGLASFWVGQRRKQIGVRRALGATRGDILRYFQIENFLIVGIGSALGMLLAYALSLAMMRRYALPFLPWAYLPVGTLALLCLGQLAVLAPALKASAVPPVVATRSV